MQDKRGYIVVFSRFSWPVGSIIPEALAGDYPIEVPTVVIAHTDIEDLRGQFEASGQPFYAPKPEYQFFHRVIAE